ncbi:MAG: exosortase/archaeosortase family protein [Planctomycetaceae bacterium]|nr:exosortase/archaeosortase family protein [Planctomycetaceae bacterium]
MQTPSENGSRVQDELKRLIPAKKELIAWIVVAVAFVLFSWSSISKLGRVWWNQEDYQHGFVVPLFSLFLLYWRRDMILPFKGRGSLWGLAFFAVWAAMRWITVYFNYESLPEMSIVPFCAGLALFVGGWQGFRWAWPSVLFLVFMIPLPGAVQDVARLQLQQIATKLSVFVIQTLGIPAVQDSVVIQMTDRPLRIAEACSGLRMMSLFFAACIGAAFIIRKPAWEKLLLIVSAVPIAIASNVVRIVLTASLCEVGRQWPSLINPEHAEKLVHDGAGLLMPIVGLLLLWGEVILLSKLLIAPLPQRPLVVGRLAAGRPAGAGTRRQATGEE